MAYWNRWKSKLKRKIHAKRLSDLSNSLNHLNRAGIDQFRSEHESGCRFRCGWHVWFNNCGTARTWLAIHFIFLFHLSNNLCPHKIGSHRICSAERKSRKIYIHFEVNLCIIFFAVPSLHLFGIVCVGASSHFFSSSFKSVSQSVSRTIHLILYLYFSTTRSIAPVHESNV